MQEHRRNTDMKRLSIPVGIAVILILLIVLVIRGNRIRAEVAEQESVSLSVAESESLQASIEASIAESEAAEPEITLESCEDSEITELIHNYFRARLSGDAEALYALYGRDADSIDPDLAAKLTAQSSWVRNFEDITIWLLPGEDENTKLGVVTYKVNFRRVNTLAPGIMYFYLKKNADGSWQLEENLLKETRELISKELEEAGVKQLAEENAAELRQALDSDSDLALMYESFRNGEIYSEYNLDPDREQQVDLFTDPQDSILLGE